MNGLDETLGRALHDTAERYHPSEVAAARERFAQRRRTRRMVRGAATLAAVAACIAGLALLVDPEVSVTQPIRPASGSVITVGDAPGAIAIFDGAAWVVNEGDGTVTRVDARSTEVEEIELDDQARPHSITEGQNALWFTDEFLPGFAPIEPEKSTVPTSFPVAGPGSDVRFGDIVVGAGQVWIANTLDGDSRVSTFVLDEDPGEGAGHTYLSGGEGMVELAFGGSGAWRSYAETVGPYAEGPPHRVRVAQVAGAGDLTYGAESLWTVVEGGAVVRLAPKVRRITVDEDGEVTRDEDGEVTREEPVGLEISAKIAANAEPDARIAFGEGSVWVVSGASGTGELVQIDPAKDEVVGRFRLSGGPFSVAADAGWLWVTDEDGDRIMRIDPKSPGGRPSTP